MTENELSCIIISCGAEDCNGECDIWNETKSAIYLLKKNLELTSIDLLLESLDADKRLVKYAQNLFSKDESEFYLDNKRDSTSNLDFIDTLSGYEFELLISELYAAMGYSVEHTKKTRDGGVDIKAVKNNKCSIIQCKRYAPKKKIGINVIRVFLGVINTSEKINNGVIISSAGFTKPVEKFAEKYNIQLINRIDLKRMLNKYIGNLPGFNIKRGIKCSFGDEIEDKIEYNFTLENTSHNLMTNLKVRLKLYNESDRNIDEIFPEKGTDELEIDKTWEYKFNIPLNPMIDYCRISIQFNELKIKHFHSSKYYL